MHILADGTIKQKNRKWYSLRDTVEIYNKGGQVILTLKDSSPLNVKAEWCNSIADYPIRHAVVAKDK